MWIFDCGGGGDGVGCLSLALFKGRLYKVVKTVAREKNKAQNGRRGDFEKGVHSCHFK